MPSIVDKNNRLDSTDAKFVQCLHTSALMGTHVRLGHADYRANGGQSQPGCFLNPPCDHVRSLDIFRSSLDPANAFVGTLCADASGDWINNIVATVVSIFQKRKCNVVSQDLFGIYTSRSAGVFDFDTTDRPPFVKPLYA